MTITVDAGRSAIPVETKDGGGFWSRGLVDISSPTPMEDLPAGNIVNDGFESADMSAPGYPDFEWLANDGTSVVTMDNVDGPVAVYNNGVIYNPDTENPSYGDKDWTALSGDYCLRSRYPANNVYADPEQGFRLVNALSNGVRELWIRLPFRVPENYNHRTDSPSNNKLLAIWMDGYSQNGDGASVVWEYWNDPDNPGGSEVAVHWSTGGFTQTGGHTGYTKFITYPEDQGRWMYLWFKVVASSAQNADDGSVQLYRQWANEGSRELLHDFSGLPLNPPSSGMITGWREGYITGASNGWPEPDWTEILIDNVAMSSGSLL